MITIINITKITLIAILLYLFSDSAQSQQNIKSEQPQLKDSVSLDSLHFQSVKRQEMKRENTISPAYKRKTRYTPIPLNNKRGVKPKNVSLK